MTPCILLYDPHHGWFLLLVILISYFSIQSLSSNMFFQNRRSAKTVLTESVTVSTSFYGFPIYYCIEYYYYLPDIAITCSFELCEFISCVCVYIWVYFEFIDRGSSNLSLYSARKSDKLFNQTFSHRFHCQWDIFAVFLAKYFTKSGIQGRPGPRLALEKSPRPFVRQDALLYSALDVVKYFSDFNYIPIGTARVHESLN